MSWLDALRKLIGTKHREKTIQEAPKRHTNKDEKEGIETKSAASTDTITEINTNLSSKNKTKVKTDSEKYPSIPQITELAEIPNNISLTADLTQFPSTGSNAASQQITIGLDFGTAFTKVVIGEVRKCYAVPFKNSRSGNPYLLPCILKVSDTGECSFDNTKGNGKIFPNLKMNIIERKTSEELFINIAAFLALVIRYSRNWLMVTHKIIYEGHYLDWYINLGLPTESYHDEILSSEYLNIIQTAWALSILPEPVSIIRSKEFYNYLTRKQGSFPALYSNVQKYLLHPQAIGLFPEFVAQITGYVRSPLRKSDLHLMVDIGAGTIDIAVFNINEMEGENRFPIFAKTVKPLGTQYLMKHRMKKLEINEDFWNVHDKVPSREEFISYTRIPGHKLDQVDQHFRKEIGNILREQLRYTKDNRYPGSPRWVDGVPTFLCGGGGKVDFYKGILTQIEKAQNHTWKIRLQRLPKPDRLDAPDLLEGGFDLLSVAYGLSFNALDIGQIIRANEIEDVSRQSKKTDPYSDRYISKEMV